MEIHDKVLLCYPANYQLKADLNYFLKYVNLCDIGSYHIVNKNFYYENMRYRLQNMIIMGSWLKSFICIMSIYIISKPTV